MPFIFQIILIWFFLSFAYITHKDPRKGLYAVIFFMPAYLIRFAVLGIPTTALEIMIYILFSVWLIGSRNKSEARKWIKGFFAEEKLLVWGIALLLLGVILSTLHSADFRTSLGAFKGWFIDPLLFSIVYAVVIKDKEEVRKSLLSFVLSSFCIALIALVFAAMGSFTFDGRLRAFYESPNYLAMYLAPAFLFAFSLFGFGKSPKRNDRKMQIIILAVLFLAILLTHSYGAVLGIGVALLSLFLKDLRNKDARFFTDNKKTLTFVAVAALLIFVFLSMQKYEQITDAGERSSLASRFMIWNSAKEMLEDSPVFGIGPGTFQQVYLEYQSRFTTPYLEWAVPQPHNTFLAFYLQAGLVGFAGFILILLWLLKRAKSDDIVLIFLIYFLVHGLVDTLYWKNDLALIFWLIIGIGLAVNKKQFNLFG
jgi:O-antigen ligase